MACAVDLYWLPLGAGGHSVRLNGRAYEALVARREHRAPLDLYHAALAVWVDARRTTIEVAPVPRGAAERRGVVATGAVGSRLARRLRIFRYEVRRWPGGTIPDAAEAVDSPRRLTEERAAAERLLAAAPHVPLHVWGRDEIGAGDMWNSNSVVAWLLVQAGLDAAAIAPPPDGRAPGWRAGLVAARDAAPLAWDRVRATAA